MCLSPLSIINPAYDAGRPNAFVDKYIQVPCGKCIECQKAEISARMSTLLMEFQSRDRFAVFCTLTLSDVVFLQDMSGVKKDHLRPLIDALQFQNKYRGKDYAWTFSSEYGSTTDRPHYHGILFGFDNLKDAEDFLSDHWRLGLFSVSAVNDARFNYMASCHITKQSHVPQYVDFDTGEVLVCNNPFTCSSNRLGYAYVDKNYVDLYKRGFYDHNGRVFHLSNAIKQYVLRRYFNNKKMKLKAWKYKDRKSDNLHPENFDFYDPIVNFRKYLKDEDSDFLDRLSPTEVTDKISHRLKIEELKFDETYRSKNPNSQNHV